MLSNRGLRETESPWVVILHMDGSLGAQEKELILFGKALSGQRTEAGVENSLQWNEVLISGEKKVPKHDNILCVLPAFNHLDISSF